MWLKDRSDLEGYWVLAGINMIGRRGGRNNGEWHFEK
jgi:hypothetical protein